MNPEAYKIFKEHSDEKLFEYVTERESSQSRHVAMHILEMRRNEPLRRAADLSAQAAQSSAETAKAALTTARWAMAAALLSAIGAIIALFHR
jgi:16S rRNA C1402 N4-methylase RsmH